ncbi:fumarylacetoacetate hydrolase family protein [soil metagenome]
MKIVTFQRRSGSKRAGLLVAGNRVLDLGRAYSRLIGGRVPADNTAGIIDSLRGMSSSLVEILQAGDDSLTNCYELEKAAEAGNMEEFLFPIGDTPLVAPIPVPPLLLHFEAHEAHARATHALLGVAKDLFPKSWFTHPIHYLGNPHTIIGPGAVVTFPDGEKEMDFEFEFAAVLSEDVRDASVEDAEEAILGYTVVNDWTARGLQRDLMKAGFGASKSKTFATSVGPYIVTKDEIASPYDLEMIGKINGEEVCKGNTGDGRFTFGEMISYASEGTVLPAGTIICAGAIAKGSGLELGKYLKAGDTVELEIDGIGVLRNKVYEKQHPRVYHPRTDE